MSLGNGPLSSYRVVISSLLADRLRKEQRLASLNDQGLEFINAFKKIGARLRQDPHNLGEPIFDLPALNLVIHIAFYPPLVIEFGIHLQKPIVFLRQAKFIFPP